MTVKDLCKSYYGMITICVGEQCESLYNGFVSDIPDDLKDRELYRITPLEHDYLLVRVV